MTIKRELIRKLKLMKNDAVPLSPAECDELILILGGTIRPPNAPKKWTRPYNCAAVGDVFFGYLENTEKVRELEAELQELSSAEFREKVFAGITAKNRAEAERAITENLTSELTYLKSKIESLRPLSAETRAASHRMTAEKFKRLGISMNEKKVANIIKDLKEAAGFGKGQKFGLIEWRRLMAEENARHARRIAKMQVED